MSRTLFLTNMSKILFMINGCMGGKQCLTGIQFSFVALPLLPCVWPGMICLIRLVQRGHLWTRVQFPCSKPASGSELFRSELLTLSSVERNENNQIRTIHQMPRWKEVNCCRSSEWLLCTSWSTAYTLRWKWVICSSSRVFLRHPGYHVSCAQWHRRSFLWSFNLGIFKNKLLLWLKFMHI